MTPDAKKKLIGALVAAALAIAVAYGLIDQKQADSIRNQADQTLGTGSPPQQPAPQPQSTTTQNAPAPQPAPPQQTQPTPAPPAPAPAPQPPPPKP